MEAIDNTVVDTPLPPFAHEIEQTVQNIRENTLITSFNLNLTPSAEANQFLSQILLTSNISDYQTFIEEDSWSFLFKKLLESELYQHRELIEIERHLQTIKNTQVEFRVKYDDTIRQQWLIFIDEKHSDKYYRQYYHTIAIAFHQFPPRQWRIIDTTAFEIPDLTDLMFPFDKQQDGVIYPDFHHPNLPLVFLKTSADYPDLSLHKFSHVSRIDELIKHFIIEVLSSPRTDDGSITRNIFRTFEFDESPTEWFEYLKPSKLKDLRRDAADYLNVEEYYQLYREIESFLLVKYPIRMYRRQSTYYLYLSRRVDRLRKESLYQVLVYAVSRKGRCFFIEALDADLPANKDRPFENPFYEDTDKLVFFWKPRSHEYEITKNIKYPAPQFSKFVEINSYLESKVRVWSVGFWRGQKREIITTVDLRAEFQQFPLHPVMKEDIMNELDRMDDQTITFRYQDIGVQGCMQGPSALGRHVYAKWMQVQPDGEVKTVFDRKGVVQKFPNSGDLRYHGIPAAYETKELLGESIRPRFAKILHFNFLFEKFVRSHVVDTVANGTTIVHRLSNEEIADSMQAAPSFGRGFMKYMRCIRAGSVELEIFKTEHSSIIRRNLYINCKKDYNRPDPVINDVKVFSINSDGERVLVKDVEIKSTINAYAYLMRAEYGFDDYDVMKPKFRKKNIFFMRRSEGEERQ